MKPEIYISAAAKLAGCNARDFLLTVMPNKRPLWATYKRALVLALRDAGFSNQVIGMHIAYTPNTIDRSNYRWRDKPDIDAARQAIADAVAGKKAKAQAEAAANPRAPRSMGTFGTYYQGRTSSGFSSAHLMTREEVQR